MPKNTSPRAMSPSSVASFKRRRGGVFELPSGMVMKLRNPGGMQALIASNLLPNSLMAVVEKSLSKGVAPTPEEIIDPTAGLDANFIAEMTDLLDKLIVLCAVEPEVHPTPTKAEERDEDLLYADEIDDDDKMFVFQWVTGGTADLETFRKQHASGMASLGAVAKTTSKA